MGTQITFTDDYTFDVPKGGRAVVRDGGWLDVTYDADGEACRLLYPPHWIKVVRTTNPIPEPF